MIRELRSTSPALERWKRIVPASANSASTPRPKPLFFQIQAAVSGPFKVRGTPSNVNDQQGMVLRSISERTGSIRMSRPSEWGKTIRPFEKRGIRGARGLNDSGPPGAALLRAIKAKVELGARSPSSIAYAARFSPLANRTAYPRTSRRQSQGHFVQDNDKGQRQNVKPRGA